LPSLLPEKIYRHNNGLTHINVANSEGFSALFVVNTPVVDNSGVAHAVEHMVFRSSTAFPHPETLFQLSSLTDAKINASTHDNTTYFHCQSQYTATFTLAINYLLNGLFNPTFTAEDLRYEIHDGDKKGVIYQELLGAEQAEQQSTDKSTNNNQSEFCYGGVSTTIGKLSLQDVTQFHQKFYQASNITLVTTNADVAKIAQLIALLPKQRQGKKENTTFDALSNTENSNEKSDKDSKYSQAIKNLVSIYHYWLQHSHTQKIEDVHEVDYTQESLVLNTVHESSQKNNILIPSLATLSNCFMQEDFTGELTTIEVNNKNQHVKSVALPGLFTQLYQQAKKQLTCSESNFLHHHAYVHDERNGLWLLNINTTERILATIAGYIISAYPRFLATRCEGSCYATQALSIEHSTYLAIYTAFDISPIYRGQDIAKSLLALSQDSNFINLSLALAKIKYCRIHNVEQHQLMTITAGQLSSYLLSISNTSPT